MKTKKPTKMWIAFENDQWMLSIEELVKVMEKYKKTSKTRLGYSTDAKWHLWTTILRHKKLEQLGV